ncbi:hypothetical protein D3C86_1478740 [compost metagenome]
MTAEHVSKLRDLVDNLIETHARKVYEHQLGNRAHACQRCTSSRTHKGGFTDRSVAHALWAERSQQTASDPERPAPGILDTVSTGTTGKILAHHDHFWITRHFQMEGVVERLTIRNFSHYDAPYRYLT